MPLSPYSVGQRKSKSHQIQEEEKGAAPLDGRSSKGLLQRGLAGATAAATENRTLQRAL